MKKNILKILLVLAGIIIGYFLVLYLYPKNAGRYPFLVVLLAGDYYLWSAFKSWVKSKGVIMRNLYRLLYWLPIMLLIFTSLFGIIYSSNNWPRGFSTYLFGFIFVAYAAKTLPIFFLLLADIFRVFQFANRKALSLAKKHPTHSKGEKISRNQFLKKAGLISGGLMFSGLLMGMLKWAFDFKIHHHRVVLPKLPGSFNNLRLVQLSDIHLGSWASKSAMREAVERINELEPDLIFFTGDLVNYKTDEAFPFEEILAGLKAESGIFVSLGNHDYGDYTRWPSAKAKKQNMTDLYDFYERLGWQLLNNENRVFANEDGKLAVLGVENWGDFGRFPKYGDLNKALDGAHDSDVKLLLSHDPSHWEKIVRQQYPDIDLTFAGHTHGFQFGVEIKNIKWSPAQYVYKHWAGMYQNPDRPSQRLYVNRGLGTIGYPGRVGILPEISLFDLVNTA